MFSGTYMIRAVEDITEDPTFQTFSGMVFDLTVGILNDFFALMLIMGLHYRNFRESK